MTLTRTQRLLCYPHYYVSREFTSHLCLKHPSTFVTLSDYLFLSSAIMQFNHLSIDEPLLGRLHHIGYRQPTAVQVAAIPAIFSGNNVLVSAATGTGKTAAYLLPLLQRLHDRTYPTRHITQLILVPTRELAFQLQYMIQQLSPDMTVNPVTLTGGMTIAGQVKHSNNDNVILIATPGRILKLTADNIIDLSQIKTVVIDEADRLLDLGLGPDVLTLLDLIPPGYQACLFSATLAGKGVEDYYQRLLVAADIITIDPANQYAKTIQQTVYYADNLSHKQALLYRLLTLAKQAHSLVFCNKKQTVIALGQWLQSRQLSAQVLHGDQSQSTRRDKLRKYRQGRIPILVATDVAARGLDIANIYQVINFDIPIRGDIYIHRIGRTGRAGSEGKAISLVEAHDSKPLSRIEYHLKYQLPVKQFTDLKPKNKRKSTKKKKKSSSPYIAKKDRTTSKPSPSR